jgi:broad-specificity NMP kinase
MKLLFIYRPPAAGKLTVAQELEKRIGFRIFHNHLTIELAKEIVQENNQIRSDLIDVLRLDVIEAATKAKINLIFTFVYAAGLDEKFVTDAHNVVEKNGGEVCFVLLTSKREVLAQRVGEVSRQKYSKIKDSETLYKMLDAYDLDSPVPYPNTITIDTNEQSAAETAGLIIDHFSLT